MSKVAEQNESVSATLDVQNNEHIGRENSGRKAPQYIAGLTAALAVFSAGTALAWTGQISEALLDGALGFPLTEKELGWIGSFVPLGAASFSLFTGTICDLLGRKLTMLLLVIPSTLGWGLIVWAKSISMVYAGRFITGMTAGSYCVLSALYTSEIAQKEIRGALGSYTQLMIIVGVVYANVLGKFLSIPSYTIACGAVPILFGALFLFMPESPVYLIMKSEMKKARLVLVRLRGISYDVDKETEEIENLLKKDQTQTGMKTIMSSLSKSSTQKACVIGFGLMIQKVTCGVDATTAYTSYILTNAKIRLDPQTGTIILSVVAVITGIFQSLIVDKSGRKILLWLSALIMSICLAVVGLVMMLKDKELISEKYYVYIDYLPMVALAIYGILFAFGLGPVPWIILGEIFPQEIKSVAASVGTFLSWLTAFAVTKLFIVMDSSWGGDVTFFVFAALTGFTVIFVLILVPETKNKTFEEIQKEL